MESALKLQEAVKIATKTLREIYEGKEFDNLMLEEVELDGFEWFITLGFDDPAQSTEGPLTLLAGNPERQYKLFCIDANSGDVKSMKIRRV